MFGGDRDHAEFRQVLVEDDHLRRRLHELDGEEADAGNTRGGEKEAMARRVVDAAAVEQLLRAGARFGAEGNRVRRRLIDGHGLPRRGDARLVTWSFGIPAPTARACL